MHVQRGCVRSLLPRLRAAWLRGCVAAWQRGCVQRGSVAAWLRGCVAAWLRAAWLRGSVAAGSCERGCVAEPVRGCPRLRLRAWLRAWLCAWLHAGQRGSVHGCRAAWPRPLRAAHAALLRVVWLRAACMTVCTVAAWLRAWRRAPAACTCSLAACVPSCARAWLRACVAARVRGCVGAWPRWCVGAWLLTWLWLRACVAACVAARARTAWLRRLRTWQRGCEGSVWQRAALHLAACGACGACGAARAAPPHACAAWLRAAWPRAAPLCAWLLGSHVWSHACSRESTATRGCHG